MTLEIYPSISIKKEGNFTSKDYDDGVAELVTNHKRKDWEKICVNLILIKYIVLKISN